MKTKKSYSWWSGLIIVILSALVSYLSSCSSKTSFSIIADSIEKPNINFSDSTKFSNPLNY